MFGILKRIRLDSGMGDVAPEDHRQEIFHSGPAVTEHMVSQQIIFFGEKISVIVVFKLAVVIGMVLDHQIIADFAHGTSATVQLSDYEVDDPVVISRVERLVPAKRRGKGKFAENAVALQRGQVHRAPIRNDDTSHIRVRTATFPLGEIRRGKVPEADLEVAPEQQFFQFTVHAPVPVKNSNIVPHQIDRRMSGGDGVFSGRGTLGTACWFAVDQSGRQ